LELRDFIVTPIVILIVYTVAYILRSRITDEITRPYFFPALTAKILGALALGFIYQFYYSGGDTYNFHTYGSRHIWEAFMDNPATGFKLLFGDGSNEIGIYKYSSRIPFFHDRSSFMVIRIAAVFDLFTFSSYSATAVFFAVISFIGLWMLFVAFYEVRPDLHRLIAIATLFVPSVVFWGSGLLKDTITLAGLGIATLLVKRIFLDKRLNIFNVLLLLLCFYIIFSIKKYILLSYLPAVMIWIYVTNLSKIRSTAFKIMMLPFVVAITGLSGYFAITQVGKDDSRYALDQLGNTAMITAYDIAYLTGHDAGSTYTLGELDGSFGSLVKLSPQAINVSLFRPYIWEVRNPLMLMSAIESLTLLSLTIYVVFKRGTTLFAALMNPHIIFCIVFSLTFAFAVGVSTFNFGTLSRYKIPLLPFYTLALILIYHENKDRNVEELESTE
jgi:hypothetical protein